MDNGQLIVPGPAGIFALLVAAATGGASHWGYLALQAAGDPSVQVAVHQAATQGLQSAASVGIQAASAASTWLVSEGDHICIDNRLALFVSLLFAMGFFCTLLVGLSSNTSYFSVPATAVTPMSTVFPQAPAVISSVEQVPTVTPVQAATATQSDDDDSDDENQSFLGSIFGCASWATPAAADAPTVAVGPAGAVTWSDGPYGCRDFAVSSARHPIPITGAVWAPKGKPVATIWLQHGSTGSCHDNTTAKSQKVQDAYSCTGKELEPYVLGQTFAENGCLAISMDGPCHGRRDATNGKTPVKAQWHSFRGTDGWSESVENDYREVCAALTKEGLIDPSLPAGFWGLSMGGVLGTIVVARHAVTNLKAAVLGKCGTGRLVNNDVKKINVPILNRMQFDDEHCTRERYLGYFQAIGCDDKRLLAYPGFHSCGPDEAVDEDVAFLMTKLQIKDAVARRKI